jgi:DNA end-binding protein Ku
MKSVWKGSIAFGLVNIPIKLFVATESHALGFVLLHEKCHTPLKYHRWCPHCKKEVSWDQTVKGIKKENGKYLILTHETLKELHPEKTDTIQLVEFVDADKIEVIYLNHHYYVAPSKKDDVGYALFVKALSNLGKAAIGRFVMRNKEYTCALQPYKEYLLLTTLYYAYEIRGIEHLAVAKSVKLSKKELELAQDLIKKLSVKTFNINEFKDTFAQEIKTLLKQKTKKGAKKKIKEVSPRRRKKVSLIDSLHASIEGTRRQPVAYAKGR